MPTDIQWVKNKDGSQGKTWNPVTGCTPISEGCARCYAKRLAEGRLQGRCGYPSDEPFRVTYHPERLRDPLKWKKPQTIFVCSMGDLFHEDVKIGWLTHIFDMIFKCPQHTFIILTKRPERIIPMLYSKHGQGDGHTWQYMREGTIIHNVWWGCSCENQHWYDERIAYIKQVPADTIFVSIEPCLGNTNLNLCHECQADPGQCYEHNKIDWVILGSESGSKARPMKHEWAFNIMDQCRMANVPLFYKQGPDDDGVNVKMPKLLGRTWNQMPRVKNEICDR